MPWCPVCGQIHDLSTGGCPNSIPNCCYPSQNESCCPTCGRPYHSEPTKLNIDCTYHQKPYVCPVCNGQGIVSKPPNIPGDVNQWVSSGTGGYTCPACKGNCVLWG